MSLASTIIRYCDRILSNNSGYIVESLLTVKPSISDRQATSWILFICCRTVCSNL